MAEQEPNSTQRMINSTNSKNPAPSQPPKKGTNAAMDSTIQRVLSDLNNLTRRLRIIEERFMEVRKKVDLVDENSMAGDKELQIQNKATTQEMSEVKKTVSEMKDKMNIMIKELQGSAKLTDVKVLEKYISMWEPIDYVTYESVEKTVEHMVDLKMNELNLKIQQENFIRKEIEKRLGNNQSENISKPENKTEKITDEDGKSVYEMDESEIESNKEKEPRNILKEEPEKIEKSDDDSELEQITNEINDIFSKKTKAIKENSETKEE